MPDNDKMFLSLEPPGSFFSRLRDNRADNSHGFYK